MAARAVGRRADGAAGPGSADASDTVVFARSIVPDLLAVVGLAVLPLLYFWRLFTPNPADQMTIVEGDFTHEYFPVLVTAARALQDGELPLWNPFSNGGQPLLADPQAALLYPPTWWALAGIEGFDGASLVALERLIPLHFALAGVFAYLLGRTIVGTRLGGLVVALVFTYSGFLTSYPVQQLPVLRSVAWFPLQLLAVWLALDRRDLRWSALGGVALALAVLGGHPQTAFLELVGLAVVAAVWVYQQGVGCGRWMDPLWRAGLVLAVVVVVGASLSAAQWLPTYEFTRLSNRADVGYQFLAAGFRLWEVPMALAAPRVLGGLPPYVGLLPLLLAAIALVTLRQRYLAVAVALGIVGVVLSLGGNSFLYPALYQLVPGFDVFRQQERAIFLFTIGAALLAGGGASALSARLPKLAIARLGALERLGVLGLLLAAAVGGLLYANHLDAEASGVGAERWRDMVHWYFFFIFVSGLALGLLALRRRVRAIRPIVPVLMIGLIVFDLFTVSWDVNLEDRHPDDVYRASEIVRYLESNVGLGRVLDDGVLNGNHGLVYGIPSVSRTFPLHLDRFTRATDQLPRDRLFQLLDVRFVVTREPQPDLGEPVLSEQFRELTNLVYERRSPTGAAWVAPGARVVGDPSDALAMLADPSLDITSEVVLEAPQEGRLAGGQGTVEAMERGWSWLRVDVQAPEGGYLVLSEMDYPGWTAEVDGQAAPLMAANYLLRAVWLPSGASEVELRYQPITLRAGLIVSAISLTALFVWCIWLLGPRWRWRRRASS